MGDAPPKRKGSGRPGGNTTPPGATPPPKTKDKPPSRGRPPKATAKQSTSQVTKAIEDALAEVLTAPAMAAAFQGDEWAVQHFTQNGRELAKRIAEVSERNPKLRQWCEKAMEGESVFVVGLAAVGYIVPALLHYNIIPGPEGLMGVPRRPSRSERKRAKQQMTTADSTQWESDIPEAIRMQREAEAVEKMADEFLKREGVEFEGGDDAAAPPTFSEAGI